MKTDKKLITTVIIFLLAFSVMISFLILPLFEDIRNYSRGITVVKEKIFLLEKKKKNLSKLNEENELFATNLNKLRNFFVNLSDPINFLNFLEQTITNCGLESKIFFLTSEEKNTLRTQITLLGSFPSFLRFLEKIENAPYLIEVEGINVRKLTEEDLEMEQYRKYSFNDVEINMIIRVLTEQQ